MHFLEYRLCVLGCAHFILGRILGNVTEPQADSQTETETEVEAEPEAEPETRALASVWECLGFLDDCCGPSWRIFGNYLARVGKLLIISTVLQEVFRTSLHLKRASRSLLRQVCFAR